MWKMFTSYFVTDLLIVNLLINLFSYVIELLRSSRRAGFYAFSLKYKYFIIFIIWFPGD